jgi:hypothetical protein
MMDQQLVARIKRRSKYWGQTEPNEWFDIRVVDDAGYRLRGKQQLPLGRRGDRRASRNGSVVDLASSKTSPRRKTGQARLR